MPDEKRTSGSGVRLLAKVGPPQFMEALIERGLVHMQRADYYAKGEASADPARIDKWEGARHIGQARRIKSLRLHDPKGDIELAPHLVGQLLFNPGGPQEPHIYCMYALTMPALYAAHADGHRQPIDPRIADFGSAAIVFKDSQEFIRRLEAALKKKGLAVVRELVEYVPEASFHGWRAPFVKPDRFAYQSEARFAVVGRRDEVLQVELGPLHDIAEPVLTSALFELEYDLSEEDSDEK